MSFSESYPIVSVCQPVEDALRRQLEQERLLNQVTSQIRQSLELPVILETAVQRVREFLQADRLLIYQFDISSPIPLASNFDSSALAEPLPVQGGRITYEARASEAISSVLSWVEPDCCFQHKPPNYQRYPQGVTLAVTDVELAYTETPCLLELLRKFQIRAKLVAPIVIQQQLWGLVIAHQCTESRVWEESEQNFLKQIAEHLAIAIYQAELYAQLQQQKQTLEQKVIERTQELRDTLLAAQTANRAKSEFLANITHEFRTPLTTVIGMSDTLLRWSFGSLSEKQRHYLQSIHDSGRHLLELINDVLDLSQLEAGKMLLKVREFSLTKIAQQCLRGLKDTADRSEVQLQLEIQQQVVDSEVQPPLHELSFCADRRRVKQILLNLLSNAIKFTPAGGKVTLRVWLENGKAALQVEDTGIGIPQEQMPQLFQKFQQLDASYGREYSGTGLGLALTKQLVELHGGWIEVESQVGVGSTFTVWLLAQPLPEPGSSSSKALHLGRIVLIESREEVARHLCDMLTTAGHQVIWMVDSLSAVPQIQLLHPQLVILSLQLGGMDGADIVAQLRNLPNTGSFKILALSSQGLDVTAAATSSIGADAYLTQPVDPQTFLNQVDALISIALSIHG